MTIMRISDVLDAEWKPALGCTEPAAVAHAAALAAGLAGGEIQRVTLRCDARTYKNCYAVGLPNSGHRTGILWALAIGASLDDCSLGLRSFEGTTAGTLERGQALLDCRCIEVEVDPRQAELHIDVAVIRAGGTGRAVIEQDHSQVTRLEKDGQWVGGQSGQGSAAPSNAIRAGLADLSIRELMALAGTLDAGDRNRLREGALLNLAMARHGLILLPDSFAALSGQDSRTRLSRLVSAGVFARMSGEPLTVMTLAGSGNKGITVSVPVTLWGREAGHSEDRIDEALALACLMTAVTTHHLGTLSAICGAANAAGIGVASALVALEGGGPDQVGLAVNNMVGNLAGMVCDGAKIGCAMKTMTGVDAAFRAANLALSGIGIPETDGIVGSSGEASLLNLGRLAQRGMASVDTEILDIMQQKLMRS
jgi:L-cysteine desulfidase